MGPRHLDTETVIYDPTGQPELRNTVIKIAGDGSYLLSFYYSQDKARKMETGVWEREKGVIFATWFLR